ncbi:hypothetical protein L218DRAFT_130345 [Marasmius fiardii PR-910]|nr:hypothetical protein L218DRAFT_130345 [Marasmius fiardii PR-910]
MISKSVGDSDLPQSQIHLSKKWAREDNRSVHGFPELASVWHYRTFTRRRQTASCIQVLGLSQLTLYLDGLSFYFLMVKQKMRRYAQIYRHGLWITT